MNRYQREIESLLYSLENSTNDELRQLYTSLADEINQEVLALAKEIEETEKFSKKLQQERLESIRQQLYGKAHSLDVEQKKSIYEYLKLSGQTSFNELFYDFEMSEKIPLTFSMLPEKQLLVIINTPVAGRKLSTRLKGNVERMKQNLNNVLTRGFAKGLSTQKMAQQISEIGEASYKRGLNIARTEAGRVSSVARQHSQREANKLGIETKKQWVSTLDMKTRSSHAKLDGQIKHIERNKICRKL